MGTADRSVWFVGDLGDPWVASLAEVLPAGARRIACSGDLPDEWPAVGDGAPRVVVLHRAILTHHDGARLAGLRACTTPTPRVLLCPGPHVRHGDLERWAALGLIDAVIPDATARDTIARHLAAASGDGVGDGISGRPERPRARVAVVSTNPELRRTLADACEALGYPAEPACDWSDATPTGPAVWDVPVLEPDWPRSVARRSRRGPLVVLLGFADRSNVAEARAHGAAACLELPCDLLDLGHVLDRVATPRGEPAHVVPPRPSARRATRPEVAGTAPGPYNQSVEPGRVPGPPAGPGRVGRGDELLAPRDVPGWSHAGGPPCPPYQ